MGCSLAVWQSLSASKNRLSKKILCLAFVSGFAFIFSTYERKVARPCVSISSIMCTRLNTDE